MALETVIRVCALQNCVSRHFHALRDNLLAHAIPSSAKNIQNFSSQEKFAKNTKNADKGLPKCVNKRKLLF